jgi:diguanylate cyclase (GGDEF)-like protein
MSWISSELQPFLALVAATIHEDGTVIEANAGFLRIAKLGGQDFVGAQAADVFVQPKFVTLVETECASDGEIYSGLLTMGDQLVETRTFRGRVWRRQSTLVVLAEYNIEEIETISKKLLELNNDYADAQRDLAQTNLMLQQREAQIVALTLSDSLTGLGNRRLFEQALATEVKRSERTGESLCAFMADLDHFKQVNDNFGHEMGDKVLAAFGGVLRRQTRATEIVTRTGGEEFVVLMPHTDLVHCVAAAERIRKAIAAERMSPMPNGVTASFGVAKLAQDEPGDAFMRRIDKALYVAKHSGRNCVVAA